MSAVKKRKRASSQPTADAKAEPVAPASRPPVRWLLLVHQLPPRPPYLRAKIAQRLAAIGALPLKNSVYVLPARDGCREDLEWIAREATAGGGQAWIALVEWLSGTDDERLRDAFRAQADAACDRFLASFQEELSGRSPRALAAHGELAPLLASFRTRFERVRSRDFFGCDRAGDVARWLDHLATASARRGRKAGHGRGDVAALRGKVWVTRRDVFVDRIATAWLVRRFVDPDARFRFVPGNAVPARPSEIRFDMAEAEITHEGDRCTFETLLDRLDLEDPALERIAQMVHDIDLHDGRFGHPETAGLEQMLLGLVALERGDARRLEQGGDTFDRLYRALRAKLPPAGLGKRRSRGGRRGSS